MSRADLMSAESRIAFEVVLLVVSILFLAARTWVLRSDTPVKSTSNSNSKTNRLSTRISGIALWLTMFILIGVAGSNIWTMAVIIRNRDSDIPKDPYFQVPLHLVETVLKLAFALKIFYICGLYLIKVAFLGIFIKFLNHVSRMVRIAIRVTITIVVACFIVSIGLTTFWCQPISSNWNFKEGPLCSSFHSAPITWVLTICNILTDLLIMAPPLLIFRSLRLQRRELLGMFLIFGLGMICIIAACVRLHFLLQFINAEGEEDKPSQQNEIVVASELEVCIAIWAGCLPAMRTLVRRRGSTSRSRSQGSSPGKLTSQLGPQAMSPTNGVSTYITAGKGGNLERKTSVFGNKKSVPSTPVSPFSAYTSVDPRAGASGGGNFAGGSPTVGGSPQGIPQYSHTRTSSHVSFGREREHRPQQPSLQTRTFTSPDQYPLSTLESPSRYSPHNTSNHHPPGALSPPPRPNQRQPSHQQQQPLGRRGPYHSSSTDDFNAESPRPPSQGVGIEDEYYRDRGRWGGRSRDGSGGSIV